MKWIFHEREARMIYSLTTDRQPMIYLTTYHLLARLYIDSNTQKNDEKANVSFICFEFFAIT